MRLRSLFEKWGVSCVVVADATAARAALERLPLPPVMLVLDAGEREGASLVEELADFKCPRLLLYPFGQTMPSTGEDEPPMASTSKPIRTSSLLAAIASLFSGTKDASATGVLLANRPVGEEIPLDILLAEDNAVNQKVALRFLERLGYRADAVANGLEALETLERRRYDLVLMDLQMPVMDGFEATRQIRTRLAADRQPKIIALTANAMAGDRDLCIAAGMDDHISKPVKMHEIAAAIRRHFSKPVSTSTGEQVIG
jgi:CheY-like chemotaxis protein